MALVTQSDKLASKFLAAASSLGLNLPAYLDDFTFAIAVSLRRLRSAYTGACMKVRHVTHNAEAEVAFDGYVVTLNSIVTITLVGTSGYALGQTMTLAAFAAGADVRIRFWYDQSGNGRNMFPQYDDPGYQPKLLTAGAFTLENGKPIVQFAAGNESMQRTYTFAQPWVGLVVGKVPASGGNPQMFSAKKVGAALPAGYFDVNNFLAHRVTVDGAPIVADTNVVSESGKLRAYAGKINGATCQVWVDGVKTAEGDGGSAATQAEDFRIATTWNNARHASAYHEAFLLAGSPDIELLSKRCMAYYGM